MLNVNFNPFPNLFTERLALRQIHINDAQDLFIMRSDINVMRYIHRPMAKTIDDVITLITTVNESIANTESISWAITLKDNPHVIGTIGYVRMAKEHYRAEVGYLLSPAYQGKGIMHEALSTVIDYGFNTMHLHSIEAVVSPENVASAKVLKKMNFVKEASFKENKFYEGGFYDTDYYGLLKSRK